MKHAYSLMGVMILIVFGGAYFVFMHKAVAPEEVITSSNSSVIMSLTLMSPAFVDGGLIPSKYTCDGENISPEIQISGIPEGTKSLVLVMDDPDIPESVKRARGIQKFNHWSLYNISPETKIIKEGEAMGSQGTNSKGEIGYAGACPPDREHRYIFRLYALSGTLNFIQTPTLDEIETAAQSMTISSSTLIGRYNRIENTQ